MPVQVEVSVGEPDVAKALESTLSSVASAGEEWLGVLRPLGRAWDLVLEGPRRIRPWDAGWSVVPVGAQVRYRRALLEEDQSAPAVAGLVLRLALRSLEFERNPIAAVDPALGRAFEQAVLDGLHEARPCALQVRFSLWRDAAEGVKFACKLEPPLRPGASFGWRWWSPLVRTPSELRQALEAAVCSPRHPRCAAREALSA